MTPNDRGGRAVQALLPTGSGSGSEAEWLADALDDHGHGFVVVNELAVPLYASTGARSILARAPALVMNAGRLRASRAEDEHAIGELCSRIRFAARNGAVDPDHITAIGAPGEAEASLLLKVCWSGDARIADLPHRHVVVVRIYERQPAIHISRRLLCRFYRLTATEAALAASLAEGMTLKDFSQAQGSAITTVRSQLRAVFGKLGVCSQPALVRTLLTGPFVVSS